MHTKIASLWRFIRTPALLTSTTVLLISCASKNPLIDEVEQPQKEKSVVSATTEKKTVKADKPEPEKTKAVTTVSETELASEADNDLNRQPTGMRKWISKLTPYKVDIQQGNFVSAEMLSRLKEGMTKEQVRFVLGTPLLTDMFHSNRWDYLFRLQKPSGAITTNRVTIYFKDNLVERIQNDNLPDEAQYLSHIAGDKVPTEKTKKNSPDEYKAAEKKAPDLTEKKPSAQPENNSRSSGTPDEPVSTPEPVTSAKPVTTTEPATTAEPVKTVEPADIVEPAKTAEPVRTVEPVKRVEPASVTEPLRTPVRARIPIQVSQPEPASAPEKVIPSETTSTQEPVQRLKRPEKTKPVGTDTTDDESSSPKNNMKTFEPISIPSRTGKMLPPSPNDQLIGNIQ